MLAAGQVVHAIAQRIPSASVFTSRAWPIDVAELPAWRVTAEGEEVERAYVEAGTNTHTLSVECAGYARKVDSLDDELHALAAAAIAAIFDPDPQTVPDALDALASRLQVNLARIDRAFTSEGQADVGRVIVTLTVDFAVDPSDPETIL